MIASAALDLVVVVPCHDEARRLDLDAFLGFEPDDLAVAFLVVDDGSRDATAELLEEACRAAPERLGLLRLETNRDPGGTQPGGHS